MAVLASLRWQVADESRFDWRAWGDDTVVYALASGSTHVLTHAMGAVLRTLVERRGLWLDLQQIVRWMDDIDPDGMALDASADELQALIATLEALERLQLVECRRL